MPELIDFIEDLQDLFLQLRCSLIVLVIDDAPYLRSVRESIVSRTVQQFVFHKRVRTFKKKKKLIGSFFGLRAWLDKWYNCLFFITGFVYFKKIKIRSF